MHLDDTTLYFFNDGPSVLQHEPDFLAADTPARMGVGCKPPYFLHPGDVVRCEVDGIGVIENKVGLSSA